MSLGLPGSFRVRVRQVRPPGRWYADVLWNDGRVWTSWQGPVATKGRLLDMIEAVCGRGVNIVEKERETAS